mmetsp:Transcript_89413/g.279882  ORF Transcript_89413/g.279882 Transcript_89413/m.279882 type:complete len:309 (+) Transcript_89413:2-928(+)
MPEGWTDGVVRFDLSVMFDAHGLPAVCIVARRAEATGGAGGRLRSGAPSAGIWEVDAFQSERLPAMHEALMLARAEESPGVRRWEHRVWSEIGIEDYKAVLDELPPSTPPRVPPPDRSQSPESSQHGWSWLSGAAAQLKSGARAMRHSMKEPKDASIKDVKEGSGHEDAKAGAHTQGASIFSFGGSLKNSTPTAARKIARAVSPASLLRSVSAGRLDRPSSRSFVPPTRGGRREPADGSEGVRTALRGRGGRWHEEMEQQFGPPLARSPAGPARGSPADSPKTAVTRTGRDPKGSPGIPPMPPGDPAG